MKFYAFIFALSITISIHTLYKDIKFDYFHKFITIRLYILDEICKKICVVKIFDHEHEVQ